MWQITPSCYSFINGGRNNNGKRKMAYFWMNFNYCFSVIQPNWTLLFFSSYYYCRNNRNELLFTQTSGSRQSGGIENKKNQERQIRLWNWIKSILTVSPATNIQPNHLSTGFGIVLHLTLWLKRRNVKMFFHFEILNRSRINQYYDKVKEPQLSGAC